MTHMPAPGGLRPPASERPAHDMIMREEADRILGYPSFLKSPVLSKLLNFLVEETIAGRGAALKGYAVAVDGLGRSDDFDGQTDSYPRVQVGRLRRALESYYAQIAPGAGRCIFIQSGSYRVRLGSLASGYPSLFRPLSDTEPTAAAAALSSVLPASNSETGTRTRIRLEMSELFKLIAGAAVAVAVGVVALTQLPSRPISGQSNASESTRPTSPVVYVRRENKAGGAAIDGLSEEAYAVMVDGLRRSWVARVGLDEPSVDDRDPGTAARGYRVEVQVGRGSAGKDQLFVRLADEDDRTLLWSTSVPIRSHGSIEEDLAPLISQLSGPYGVIAGIEKRRLKASFAPGYPCLLQFLTFLSSRDTGARLKVYNCLMQPSSDTTLEATRYALLSMYHLEVGNVGLDTSQALPLAKRYAALAVAADPKHAYAQFAQARAALIGGDCARGLQSARLAADANPYDPIILGVLGGLLTHCGYREGEEFLEKAYRYRTGGESYARLSLVLAAIRTGKLDRLPAMSEAAAPKFGAGVAYHHLCETMIAAALGDNARARSHWRMFASDGQGHIRDVDVALRQVILSPPMRSRVGAYLDTQGVIPARI